MILDGLILGGLTWTAFWWAIRKLPPRVKELLKRFPFLTEAAVIYFSWLIHRGTATGLVAAAFSGILASLWLHKQSHPEVWAWLDDGLAALKQVAIEAKNSVESMIHEFKAERPDQKLAS